MTQTPFYKTFGGTAPENYERYFVPWIGAPLSTELMDAAALRPGERVVDVACGTGIIARLAAQQVAPDGSVAGVDMNRGMLDVARSVGSVDLAISWHEASAEAIPLQDGAFDVVLCQLGLQFMADKAAALRECRRVLAPGGRLALSVTGPTPQPFAILADALARHISPEISPFVHMVFSLDDPDALQALVGDAGFVDVKVKTYTRKLHLPPPRDFLWQYIHSTPLAEAVAQADEGRRAAMESDVLDQWQPFVERGAMTVSPRMLLVVASR